LQSKFSTFTTLFEGTLENPVPLMVKIYPLGEPTFELIDDILGAALN